MPNDAPTFAPSQLAGQQQTPVAELPRGPAFENSLDGILLANIGDGAIYAANPAACRLLSRSQEEIAHAGLSGIAGKRDSRLNLAFNECRQTGIFLGVVTLRCGDGGDLEAEISLLRFTNESGKAFLSVTFRAVTAQLKTEEALRPGEAVPAPAPQNANLGRWEWDIPSGELLWSDQHYRMLGLRREEFKATWDTFLELVHPDDRPLLRAALGRSLEQREPYRLEFRVVLPDTSIRHIYAQADLECDGAGKPVRMVGTSLDITERQTERRELHKTAAASGEEALWRATYFSMPLPEGRTGHEVIGVEIAGEKKAEAAQRATEGIVPEAEQQLRLLFETMQQGVVYQDAQGKITSLNPAAELILGRTAAELLGCSSIGADPRTKREDDAPFPVEAQPAAVALASGSTVRGVTMGIYHPREERYRWIEVTAVPLMRHGEFQPFQVYTIFDDITDRKQAAEALRESEERLRLAIEATGVGTFDFYPKTGQLVWSEITKSHFGISAAAPIDHDIFLGAVHADDRERIRQKGFEVTGSGSDGHLAAEYRTIGVEDGKERWLSVRGRVLYDAEGSAAHLIGTTLDITERRSLEEQLRQRAEEFQKILDIAPVILHVAHDAKCQKITANQAGYDLHEATVGTNLSASAPPGEARTRFFRDGKELSAEELPLQIAASRGEEVRDCEVELVVPSGKKLAVWGHASPLRDASGKVRGAVGAFLDITASKERAAVALHESEKRFQSTADAAPVIMWLGDTEKRVTFFNKEIEGFSGLPREQLLGDGWTQLLHPDDLEAARAIYYESVEKRAVNQVEYRARRADGEYRNMLGTSSPRFIGGEYAGQVGTVIDITDLKRRQEKDVARQKLESLGTLAGGIAHDFNNLLGGVLSQVELAQCEIAGGASPESEIKNIHAVALRGAEIVRQLMVYAGQETDSLEMVDVSRLIEESVELLQVVISKRALLERSLSANIPAVRSNPARLRQLMMNLVTNASEAIGDRDGVIRITTERLVVQGGAAAEGLSEGEYLQLNVSDTGCGMSPEAQAKIFDPFFTTKAQGRGLGLAVVQGIVRDLGGSIRVKSEPGWGTTFRVLLPGSGATLPPGESPASVETKEWSGGSVLLVEDEPTLRTAVSKMLEGRGFSVLEAADGSAALNILHSHVGELGVMLLDVTLPGIGSPEVMRQAKRMRPDIRVILTSAYSERSIAGMFQDLGAEAFVRKPYEVSELVRLIRQPAESK